MVELLFNLECTKCKKKSIHNSGVPKEYMIDLDGLRCIYCGEVNLFFPEEVKGDYEVLGNGSFEEYIETQLTIKDSELS